MTALADIVVERNAELPTWFGIGGRADRLARPRSLDELRRCVAVDPRLRVLGDGANLLVDDDGVGELVVSLDAPFFREVKIDQGACTVYAAAGANLPKLITETVRLGLGGLEGLGGIPATLGGAVVMNAGGAFGQIADVVTRVHAIDPDNPVEQLTLDREEIDFGYRRSGLSHLVITGVELTLAEEDPAVLRGQLKEVMAYKSRSQPMGDRSAGCVFKNPTLREDLAEIVGGGEAGQRVSAGMLIDRAGCKGLAVGTAKVSDKHANFVVTPSTPGVGKTRDVIALIAEVQRRVQDRFGVELEPEVVIWRREKTETEGA